MLIVYASATGNVKRFVDKLDMRAININDIENRIVDEPFIFITYTDGSGEVPSEVDDFIMLNRKNFVAISASGNRNWGVKQFARSANIIAFLYNVPILLKFEDDGEVDDVKKFKERVHKINEIYRTK
jgi:protein involved in ribonucleotide reduction